MADKILGFVAMTTATMVEYAKAHKIPVTVYPNITGKTVIFRGLDSWVLAKGKGKFEGKAWVRDIPVILEVLGIPVADATRKASGMWIPTEPHLELMQDPLPVNVKRGMLMSIQVGNAKAVLKKKITHPIKKTKKVKKDA